MTVKYSTKGLVNGEKAKLTVTNFRYACSAGAVGRRDVP